MDVRRLLIVALSISMIRVTLPGSDLVCAKHESRLSHASMVHAVTRYGLPGPAQHDQRPCDTPSQAECCPALASCGITAALGEERLIPAPQLVVEYRRASRSAVPSSRITAPEPPPPKA